MSAGDGANAAPHIFMSNLKNRKSNHYYTGISLEPEVSAYLDDLASRMRMNPTPFFMLVQIGSRDLAGTNPTLIMYSVMITAM